MRIRIFHGKSVPGTKLENSPDPGKLEHSEMFTLYRRGSPWVFHPFVGFRLLKYRPDVIIAEGGSNFLSNFIILLAAAVMRTPVVWWTLGELKGQASVSRLKRFYRTLVQWQERRASAYLGYSSVAMEYFARMGYREEKCFRAVNCVDTDAVRAGVTEAKQLAIDLKQKLDIDGVPTILFVGALIPGKRIDRLVITMKRLLDKIEDAKLVIVGDGPERAKLESLAAQLGISDSIRFVGKVVQGVQAYFQCADVFVLPGLGGLAVSEALANGLPVICTIGDGCEVDLVTPGVNGFRIESDDDSVVMPFLLDSLTMILSDRDRCDAMKLAATQSIETRYNIGTYVAGIVRAIEYSTRNSPQAL
jgi:glycosyltransferase involved in cell wall biosynthesis